MGLDDACMSLGMGLAEPAGDGAHGAFVCISSLDASLSSGGNNGGNGAGRRPDVGDVIIAFRNTRVSPGFVSTKGMSASDVGEFILSSPSTSSPPRPGARAHRSVTLRLVRPSAPSGEFDCRWGGDRSDVASDSEEDDGSVAELETDGARDVREADEDGTRGGGGRQGAAGGAHGGEAGEDGSEGGVWEGRRGAAGGSKQSGGAGRRSVGTARGGAGGRKREEGGAGGRKREELLRVAEESLAAAYQEPWSLRLSPPKRAVSHPLVPDASEVEEILEQLAAEEEARSFWKSTRGGGAGGGPEARKHPGYG
ncbi:hypothetical protein T484DRAFT_1892130 [Baffinella frigidus]|nr:hypothetical protein T484DRAFT_1892130 [Cryptophyta sp. CCMP2293]